MESKKLLLIGCGRHAFETIGPALNELGTLPDYVCDIDHSRAEGFAAVFSPGARIELDWEECLRLPVDKAIVAVSPTVHATVARACLQRGIHTLVEKPPAPNTSTARALASSASYNSKIFVGFNYRFAPAVVAFRTLISQMSRLVWADFRFWSRHPTVIEDGFASTLESWAYGNAIHALDLVVHFFGIPVSVDARSFVGSEGLIGLGSHFECELGPAITFSGGNTTPAFEFSIEVRDETGRFIRLLDLHRIVGTDGGRNDSTDRRRSRALWEADPVDTKVYRERGHLAQLHDFLTSAHPSLATINDGAVAMQLCETILKAAHSRSGVTGDK